VIGAGVGGLTLAQGLLRIGFDVAVHEKDGVGGRPQGISLHMDERGRAALQTCLPPAQAEMAEATMGGQRERAQMLADTDGELTLAGSLPMDGTKARPGRQASRPVLRAVLLAGLADVVRFESEFTHFEQQDDGTVKAWFADGSSDTADLLIGADGVGSAVRGQRLPQAQVIDTGKRMLMGATPLTAIADTGLVETVGDNPSTVQVDGAMRIALGVLRFAEPPVAARDRLLPDLRSPAIEEAEDFVMFAIPAGKEVVPADASPEDVWRVAKKLVTDLHPTVRAVVNNAWPEVSFPHRIGMIPPQPPWPATPVTLIGDAVHVAPGFGGNLAMQDARRLCEALAGSAGDPRDLLAAIGAYENAMRGETLEIAKAFAPKPPSASSSEAAQVGGER